MAKRKGANLGAKKKADELGAGQRRNRAALARRRNLATFPCSHGVVGCGKGFDVAHGAGVAA
jgi:hypothetical protein